jgi:hypothetical protein
MSKSLHGTIDVDINGTQYVLRPTLDAYRKIQVRFGGLRGALESLTQLNIEHISHIIAAGAGKGRREIPDIENDVFEHGIGDVTELVAPFVTALFNPRGDEVKEDDSGNAQLPLD